MVKRIVYILLSATAVFSFAGCTRGLLYTHTVQPLSRVHRPTTIVQSSAEGGIKRLDIPLSPFNFEWSSDAIGEIARRHGMQEVYFADREVLSIFSVWTRRTVRIYGR